MKIIDFGSSRVAGLNEASARKDYAVFAGTLDYTAPEYHLGETPTNRSDIYSLGVIVYELLTENYPTGEGLLVRATCTSWSTLPPPASMRAFLPGSMRALAKAVHKSPAKRSQALSELVEDLRRPHADFQSGRKRPLIERNAAAFWRAVAILLFVLNVVLLYRLSR